MLQDLKQNKVTKPVRVDKEWHFTLKMEATQQGTSITKLLEKILSAHFLKEIK